MKRASLHWNKAPYRRLLSLLLVAVMLFGFTGLIGNAWAADDEDVPAEEIAAEIQEEDPSGEDPGLPEEEDPSGDAALPDGETVSEDDGESEGDEGDAPPARMGSTPAQHFEGWANDIAVFVDAPENALPAGTVMEVVPVYDRATIAMIEDTVAGQGKTVKAVDISFWLGVTEIEPARSIYVTLKSDVIATADEPAEVVHVSDEGEVSVVRQLDNTEEDEVSFASREFSVYAVIGGNGDEARMQLNFHLYDGTVVPMTIKNGDNTLEKLQEIVYDPGSGVAAGSGLSFLGWTTDNPYDADSTRQSIDKIREHLLSDVIGSITETDPITTVDYYAAVFKIFTVTYYDEFGVSLGSEAVLLQPSETSSSYMVNMNYPVDDSHNFEGWKVMTSEEPGYVYTGGNIQGHTDNDHVYPNETTITITGDVDFVVEAPAGHWLVFDENGKGATFNAPQFYKEGVPTEQTGNAVASEMKRYGYSFGGWYKEVTGEADEMGYRQVVESSRYDFNEVLTENRTIYAKWTKNATAPYTIIFWTQNESSIQKVKNEESLTPQDYEVAGSYVNDNGSVGQYIPYTSVDNGAEDYATGQFSSSQYGHYTGFGLTEASKNQQIEITAEGDAVLNLYYDRIQYNFKFYLYRNGTQNNRYDYANNSGNGSSLDGVVTWHSNQTEHPGIVADYTIDGQPVSIQSESVSGRTYYYFVMPAYYGEDISGKWPTYDKITGANNHEAVSYVMMVGTKLKPNPTDQGSGTVKGLVSVMNENILGATNDPDGNYVVVRFPNSYYNWRYHIWYETIEGVDYTGYTTHTWNGKTYYEVTEDPINSPLTVRSSNTTVTNQNAPKFQGFDFVDWRGENWNNRNFWTTGNNPTLYHINEVYNRQKFKINYFDGQYVDGNNNNLQNRASHLLHESEEIQFGAAIADDYKNYVPTLPEGESGYVFEGWYVDEGCTVKYTWTTILWAA
ncbi:MAG: InlB B-repeat-containing protein [Oscillospiraceae bacterium]|nr:InlB B-repeat-containing protein [Oscillospiraceae bacterium]